MCTSGTTYVVLGSGPEPEQDQGQLLVPKTISTASPERVMERWNLLTIPLLSGWRQWSGDG